MVWYCPAYLIALKALLMQADINQSADEFEAQLLAQRRENEVRGLSSDA